ncbi:hypothetical protein E2C01_000433 [Portunus trituberculatus]|uniref:Uncharacterized protein n=1 Tax=Portunus trituberculatus TaxID=210409 RepID=A0A5B7CEX7_PORTR|nr:hypothetical protein [Portunus trituberculatus]
MLTTLDSAGGVYPLPYTVLGSVNTTLLLLPTGRAEDERGAALSPPPPPPPLPPLPPPTLAISKPSQPSLTPTQKR